MKFQTLYSLVAARVALAGLCAIKPSSIVNTTTLVSSDATTASISSSTSVDSISTTSADAPATIDISSLLETSTTETSPTETSSSAETTTADASLTMQTSSTTDLSTTAITSSIAASPTYTAFVAYDADNNPHESEFYHLSDTRIVFTWSTTLSTVTGAMTINPDTNRVSITLADDDRVFWATVGPGLTGSESFGFWPMDAIENWGTRDFITCTRADDGFLTCGTEAGQSVTIGRSTGGSSISIVRVPLPQGYEELRL